MAREPRVERQVREVQRRRLRLTARRPTTRAFASPPRTSTEGDRVIFNPYLSYSVVGPGLLRDAEGAVALRVVQPEQHRHGLAGRARRRISRNRSRRFSFDTGLIFERSVRLFGQDYIQTLEPRLYYVYTPYRNQDVRAAVRYGRRRLRPRGNLHAEHVRRQRPDCRREPADGGHHHALHQPGDRRRTRALRDRAAVLFPGPARHAAADADAARRPRIRT